MDDASMDQLLTSTGEQFRTTHTRSTLVRRRRRPAFLLPLGVGLATAGLVVGVALVLPTGDRSGPVLPPVPAAGGSFAVSYPDTTDVEISTTWVAVAGGTIGQGSKQSLQVRSRNDLSTVVFTVPGSYAGGGPDCLHLDGDWLVWTDLESIDTQLVPGPPTRRSVWVRNLVTRQQVKVYESRPATSGAGEIPCAIGDSGLVYWKPDATHLTTLTLSSVPLVGTYESTTASTGELVGSYAGLPVFQDGEQLKDDEGRVLVSQPGLTQAVAAEGDLVWITSGPDTGDGLTVRVCSLPTCSDARVLAEDPGASRPVLGSTFAAWSAQNGITVRLLNGKHAPALEPGSVSFLTLAAAGDTLAYVTQEPDGPATLHLQLIG
jgi:hypothetical protein